MVISAALASQTSVLTNVLESEDVLLTIDALKSMGADIRKSASATYTITGFNGTPKAPAKEIYLGNSGTSMRLLAGISSLGNAPIILTGDPRMCERPMNELMDSLNVIGIDASSENNTGTPPVKICGGNRQGGRTTIDCSRSSQYLSALLMIGPFFENGLTVELHQKPVSAPYIDLTMDIMAQFGVTAERVSDTKYHVPGKQTYQSRNAFVEPDISNSGYFWAAGAISGVPVFVNNITTHSLQGDLKLIHHFERMGCRLIFRDDSIGVAGEQLKGIHVDMSDTPDAVPALAIVAAFAKGETRISNIAHLREKECDRIDAVVTQLQKMGIHTDQGQDYMIIQGGSPHGADIETYNDHRIAMSFAVSGLRTQGVHIENPGCVAKSFPNFWEVFDQL